MADVFDNLAGIVNGARHQSLGQMARDRDMAEMDARERSRDMRYNTRDALYRATSYGMAMPAAALAGAGAVLNPFSPIQTVGASSQVIQQYATLAAQSRALLGGQFSESRVQSMGPSLQSFGATKQDLITYMSQLASLSMKVSQNLDVATRSVMSFAKANGLDQGQTVAFVGMASRSSNMTATQGFDYLARMRTLAGSNAMMPEYLTASQAVMGQANAMGAMADPNRTMALINGFQNLNPLYRQNPNLVPQMMGSLMGSEQNMLLGFTMSAMAKQGRSTNVLDVLAAAQNPDDAVHGEVARMVGKNRGLATALALSGQMPANLLKDLIAHPDAIADGAVPSKKGYTPDQAGKDAAGATTPMQKANATMIDELSVNSGWLKTTSEWLAKLTAAMGPTGATIAGTAAEVGKFGVTALASLVAGHVIKGLVTGGTVAGAVKALGPLASLFTVPVALGAAGAGVLTLGGLYGYDAYVSHREGVKDQASDAQMKSDLARIRAARKHAATASTDTINRDPNALDPDFLQGLGGVFDSLRAQGYNPFIAEGFRTQERQNGLVAQGRTAPGPVVTWTDHSRHTQGRAADVADRSGKPGFKEALFAAETAQGMPPTLPDRDPFHVEMRTGAAQKHTDARTAEKMLQAAGALVDASQVFKSTVDTVATRRPGVLR